MCILNLEEVGYDLEIQSNLSGSARQFSTDSTVYTSALIYPQFPEAHPEDNDSFSSSLVGHLSRLNSSNRPILRKVVAHDRFDPIDSDWERESIISTTDVMKNMSTHMTKRRLASNSAL